MCSLIDILQWKKNQKDSDDFWHRKLTLKVKFWYFLTAPHYSNFQNLVISFEYSWFLAKTLSNFVFVFWKFDNPYYLNKAFTKNVQTDKSFGILRIGMVTIFIVDWNQRCLINQVVRIYRHILRLNLHMFHLCTYFENEPK